jgi:hypothetical protein
MDRRLNEHLGNPSNKGKKAWFEELRQQGLSAKMEILEVIDAGPDASYIAKEREEYRIYEYLRLGVPLPNIRGVVKPYPKPKKRLAGLFNRSGSTVPIYSMEVFQDLLENMPATLTELARRSGVSERSIMRMRDGEKVNRSTANKVLAMWADIQSKKCNRVQFG